jgi:hypothetical protein
MDSTCHSERRWISWISFFTLSVRLGCAECVSGAGG